MHYDMIIISDLPLPLEKLKGFSYCLLSETNELKDPYHTKSGISFDYCIFSNPNSVTHIDILKDQNQIVTNCFFQTNYDHIFAIGEINASSSDLNTQFLTILNFLH